jgi:hypothetical protein
MWAMSVISLAPTARATAAMRAKSIVRGYALAPTMISLGVDSWALRSSSS